MATAQSLIDTAFTELRVKSPDTDMATQEYVDALSRLNAMMAAKVGDIATLGVTTLGSGTTTGTYPMSVGPSGAVDMVRPVRAAAVTWGQTPARAWPLTLVSWEKLQDLRLRRFSDPTNPVVACYRPEYPSGLLYLWPEPSTGTVAVQGFCPRYQWAALATDVPLPPGLQLAIEYGLAVALAGQYQVAAGEELIAKSQGAWDAWANSAEELP